MLTAFDDIGVVRCHRNGGDMRRYRVVVTVMLTAMALIAGCTSSGDTADETTTAAPATTVAPPETVTTAAAATSTTLFETAAIATVQALQEAWNAFDSDAVLALMADGSSSWEKDLAEWEAWGRQGTLSDCVATDRVLTCLETWERTNLSGKAGVIREYQWRFRFDDQGLIRLALWQKRTAAESEDDRAFNAALGDWMETAHPDAFETFFFSRQTAGCGVVACLRENWDTPEGVAELSPLIDEFVAQSDDYPLSN
jgi:ABC-type transport system substrate-binding protein